VVGVGSMVLMTQCDQKSLRRTTTQAAASNYTPVSNSSSSYTPVDDSSPPARRSSGGTLSIGPDDPAWQQIDYFNNRDGVIFHNSVDFGRTKPLNGKTKVRFTEQLGKFEQESPNLVALAIEYTGIAALRRKRSDKYEEIAWVHPGDDSHSTKSKLVLDFTIPATDADLIVINIPGYTMLLTP